MSTAFDPVDLAGTKLANRFVLGPMTRSRAGAGQTATELMGEYYAQRATAGLIITEGVQPSAVGQGYPDTPGLHSSEQVESWKKVTDRVHTAGSKIFAQLMHTGRVSHPTSLPEGLVPVGPSPVRAEGQIFTSEGMKDFVTPRELTKQEIEQTVADFASAARNAIEAGFDGVEVHGANGYLIHQFLSSNANQRTDEYGGSIAGRVRFLAEVVQAVSREIGVERVGVHLSPGAPLNDIAEDDVSALYAEAVRQMRAVNPAYLHLFELGDREMTQQVRRQWAGMLIVSPHPEDPSRPADASDLSIVEEGAADLIAYGRLFLANPDLPERFRVSAALNEPDPATFYEGGAEGFTDYPALN